MREDLQDACLIAAIRHLQHRYLKNKHHELLRTWLLAHQFCFRVPNVVPIPRGITAVTQSFRFHPPGDASLRLCAWELRLYGLPGIRTSCRCYSAECEHFPHNPKKSRATALNFRHLFIETVPQSDS
jgi:hypothetical protein